MSWIRKIKQFLKGFLATENNKYITTEDGLKLWIVDNGWGGKEKSNNSIWNNKIKEPL